MLIQWRTITFFFPI